MNTIGCLYLLLLAVCLFGLFPFVKKIILNYLRKKRYLQILKDLDLLFRHTNPFLISKQHRYKTKAPLEDLHYGEINFCALLDLMDIIKPQHQNLFYDLGSGSGKSAFAVKLRYPSLDVKGIELIPQLHEIAEQKLHEYLDKHGHNKDSFGLRFICDNLLNQNFSDGDIIFINATAYSRDTWTQILHKLIQLKRGAKIIITSKTLPAPTFIKRYQGMELMSWGFTSTYIYEKII